MIGRPITSNDAPRRIASPGVITRFCSFTEAQVGRTPGVTTNILRGTLLQMTSISRGEAIIPSSPAVCARPAKWAT